MERPGLIDLRGNKLAGAEGGAQILKLLRPDTDTLYLDCVFHLGWDGLQALVEGMSEKKASSCELETLGLSGCGLGGPNSASGFDTLSQLLRSTPSLTSIDLGYNRLDDIPSSFIDTMISHPKFDYLTLSGNKRLECSFDPSTPCVFNRLLSQLCIAASSSSLTLQELRLGELTAECCGPVLERLLSLGPRGLRTLRICIPSHARTLIRTISNDNFYIQEFSIGNLDDLVWEDGEEGLSGRCEDTLISALERNQRLEKETRQAAVKLLELSRIVFLGSPAPLSSPSELAERSRPFRILDLPTEIARGILSSVYSGALSNRQIGSVFQHAADRTTLLPRIVEQHAPLERQASPRRTRAQTRLDLEARRRLSFTKKEEFLKETGCDRYGQ